MAFLVLENADRILEWWYARAPQTLQAVEASSLKAKATEQEEDGPWLEKAGLPKSIYSLTMSC